MVPGRPAATATTSRACSKVERLSKVVIADSDPSFETQPGFDLEKFRRDNLFTPEPTHRGLRLRFDKALAYEVRPALIRRGEQVPGRRPGSEHREPAVRLAGELDLAFGTGVEVLEPSELRQSVAARSRQITQLHQGLNGELPAPMKRARRLAGQEIRRSLLRQIRLLARQLAALLQAAGVLASGTTSKRWANMVGERRSHCSRLRVAAMLIAGKTAAPGRCRRR